MSDYDTCTPPKKDWKVQLNLTVDRKTRQAVAMLATKLRVRMKEMGEKLILSDERIQKMIQIINEDNIVK